MILWVRNLGAQLADFLFTEALMQATQKYLPGQWANLFTYLIPCWYGLKAGLCWDCQLELLPVASPHSGLRAARLLIWELRALRKNIPASRIKATWPFTTQPQKSHFVTSAVL